MEKWEKPVLSILGISKTKGDTTDDLNGLPLIEVTTENAVSIESYNSGLEPNCGGGCGSPCDGGGPWWANNEDDAE